MAFPNTVQLNYGSEKVVSTTKGHKLGTRGETPGGRVFYYALAAEALGAGKLIQSPIPVANHDMDLAVQANAAVGDTSVSVTLGSTASTEDQYADGWLWINDGAGEGHVYRIKEHDAALSAGTQTVTLEEGDGVREALTTSSSLAGLQYNSYFDQLLYNTTIDGVPSGVAPTEIADNEYFWNQTWGMASVLVNGTVILGKCVVPGLSVSGSVDVHIGTGDPAMNVGVVCNPIAVNTDYAFVKLTISP